MKYAPVETETGKEGDVISAKLHTLDFCCSLAYSGVSI